MMKKTNCGDVDPKEYIREFEAKVKKELEYVDKLDAEREKKISSGSDITYLRPSELPLYIHKDVLNFKTSCLVNTSSPDETKQKPRFKQYMSFQEVLDENIEGGTTKKNSNEFTSGYTLHKRIPLKKDSSPVTPINTTCKKHKSTYKRNKKPLKGLRSRKTGFTLQTSPGQESSSHHKLCRSVLARNHHNITPQVKISYEAFMYAYSYDDNLFAEAVEFGCKPIPFTR